MHCRSCFMQGFKDLLAPEAYAFVVHELEVGIKQAAGRIEIDESNAHIVKSKKDI